MHFLHLIHAHPWIGGLIGGPTLGPAVVLLCRGRHNRGLMWACAVSASAVAAFNGLLVLASSPVAGGTAHRLGAVALAAIGAWGFCWLRWDSRDQRRHDARERDRLLGIPAEYRRAR